MTDPAKPGQHALEVLSESQVYRDYERAFKGTGLSLRLQGPTLLNVVRYAKLHTGQVLLQRPDKVQFKRLAATLLKWRTDAEHVIWETPAPKRSSGTPIAVSLQRVRSRNKALKAGRPLYRCNTTYQP